LTRCLKRKKGQGEIVRKNSLDNRFLDFAYGCKTAFLLLLMILPGVFSADRSLDSERLTSDIRIKDYGLKSYVSVSHHLPHSEQTTWKLICKLPYNCQFQPWILVECSGGETIKFNSTNPLVLYLTPTESVITSPGEKAYEAKNWISGEGAIYTIPPGVTVKEVKYRETGYDTQLAGYFKCNDDDYNILWQRAARTAYICMRGHFFDCPDRERVEFWGDGVAELGQSFYLFDSNAHLLCKNLVRRKLEPEFYPGQILEFLGEYGLWFYYLQTGDLDSLRAVYGQTKNFLFEEYKFGRPRTWFDWGNKDIDRPVIETCLYYNCLETLKKIAGLIGQENDIPAIEEKLKEIRENFDRLYWQGNYYKSSVALTPDDRANALAIDVGLAEKAKWESIYNEVLSKTTKASNFFDRWVFEALCKIGKQDEALKRMASRYRTMIQSRFTTLWEHYDRWWMDHFDDASSLNHGWNTPALVLSQTIAGISPEGPGWSIYHVFPKEAFLTSIKVAVPTIKGNIRMNLNKSADRYMLQLFSPGQTVAIVGIPKMAFSKLERIKANGRIIWTEGTYCGGQKGLSWAGEDEGYLKLKVEAGNWEFVASGKLILDFSKKPRPRVKEGKPLNKRNWTATASVLNSTFLFSGEKIPVDISAANAIDGDYWTGWRDMTQRQYPGQWFQIDMKKREKFSKIILDNTWALWDSPAEYSVSISDDGQHWSRPVAAGKGELGITTIQFPQQKARYIRITQTGTNPLYHWSIYEIEVYR
jgi:hypothetical protein